MAALRNVAALVKHSWVVALTLLPTVAAAQGPQCSNVAGRPPFYVVLELKEQAKEVLSHTEIKAELEEQFAAAGLPLLEAPERDAPFFRFSAELENRSWSLDTDFIWPEGHPRRRCFDGYDGESTGSIWGTVHASPSYESLGQSRVRFVNEIKRRLPGIIKGFIGAYEAPTN